MGDLQTTDLGPADALGPRSWTARSRVASSRSHIPTVAARLERASATRVHERALSHELMSNAGGAGLFASLRTLLSLARASIRQLAWANRRVSRELATWRSIAREIPHERLRENALAALAEKRTEAFGASLFCTLPRRRSAALLRLLVAYQTMWDFLDSASEEIAPVAGAEGRRLHLALVEALTPDGEVSDYYEFHPGTHDGGYLAALVGACQECCAQLPSYERVRPYVTEGARNCAVQAINHEAEPRRREALLRQWAHENFPGERTLPWFEVTAAASAFLPHPLLAIASEAGCTDQQVSLTCAAYFPLMSLAIVLLDSYVDRIADLAQGDHSYVAYYGDLRIATKRMTRVIGRMFRELRRLEGGSRHSAIAGCMVAMYLSNEAARSDDAMPLTRGILGEADGVTRVALAAFRVRAALGRARARLLASRAAPDGRQC